MERNGETRSDLRNEDPEIVKRFLGEFLVSYGWYTLLAVIGFYVLWSRSLKETLNKWRLRAQENSEDPEVRRAREEALRQARLRMQERYNEVASAEIERQKEREKILDEERRKKKIEEFEKLQRGEGYFSKARTGEESETPSGGFAKSSSKDSGRLRSNDYNPLSGAGSGSSSSGWRPSRPKGKCGGGGCG